MEFLGSKRLLCISCMTEHDVQIVRTIDCNIFKGVNINYPRRYYFCERSGEFYEDEAMITQNDITMKDAYRAVKGVSI